MLVFVLVYILFCTQQFELETLHVFVAFQIRFVEYDRIELNRRISLYKYLSINILYSDVAYSVLVDLFSFSIVTYNIDRLLIHDIINVGVYVSSSLRLAVYFE